jgi:hypothetical protein
MSNLPITQLPSASIATGSNVLPIVQGGVTDQITVTNLGQGIFRLNLPLTASGLLIGGNIIPSVSKSFSLGSNDFPFRDIYISSGSLVIASDNLGDPSTTLSNVDGNILISAGGMQLLGSGSFNAATGSFQYFTGSLTQVGNLTVTGSITATSGFTGSLLGTASYASNGGVTQLLAGPNVTLSPTNGKGQVTVSAILSGSTIFNTSTGSYGSFYDTTTQTNPVGNIPRSMSLNTTDITNGVSISGSTNPYNTYIKTINAGVYNIQFSAQLDKTDSGTDEIFIWLRKNGIDLTDTATAVTLVGNNGKQVAAWNWFVNAAANDYFQIIWYALDTNVRILAEAIGGGHPGIPSVIVTANRVDQFLSNTGSFSGSFTGSLLGTASYATNHAVITSSYVCDGILNANQTFATGSDQTIAFVDYVDPNNWLASNQFKPTIAGYYSVSFGAWLQNPGVSGNQVNAQMRKNGNSVIINQQPLNNATGISLGGSRIVQMNGTTDYIDWTIFQGSGSSANGTLLQGSANGQGTWFSAFLLTQ